MKRAISGHALNVRSRSKRRMATRWASCAASVTRSRSHNGLNSNGLRRVTRPLQTMTTATRLQFFVMRFWRNNVDNNRVGDACWYRTFVNVKGKWSWTKWRGGRLRAWSTDHQEFESGPGPFPVAVIEDDETLLCASIPVAGISFATNPDA